MHAILKRRPLTLETKHALGEDVTVGTEVKTALANLTKSIGARIDAIEATLAKEAERKTALERQLDEATKAALFGTAGGGGASTKSTMT